ncbi:MAG TPA: hypothetical protein VGE34_04005 [Candidatus Saccharimonadales bacterium]
MKYYYTDEKTTKFLKSNEKRVYLYGGYGGYNNFGDIIQLKNTIYFYRQNTDIEPIIMLHAASLESSEHVEKFKKWFNCEYLLFVADKFVDASDAGISLVDKVSKNGLLHIYGGGFLNKYWGKGMIEKIQDMVVSLKPKEYIFSGQQIEEATVPILNELFGAVGAPALFGVRDRKSMEYMKQSLLDSKVLYFSFDDVTEIFELWRDNTQPNVKVRIINRLRPKSIMLHINMSSYATSNKKRVLSRIRQAKRTFPKNRIMLAHIYNDIRASLKDTLQSVVQLENDFPYHEYRVVNLAQMALDLQVEERRYPVVGNVLGSVELAVVSSYHIAMFAGYFGIPAYLMAENGFYVQKQKSLGLETDFGKFMKNPEVNLKDYKQERAERGEWLKLLTTHLHDFSGQVRESKEEGMTIPYDMKDKADPEALVYRNINS